MQPKKQLDPPKYNLKTDEELAAEKKFFQSKAGQKVAKKSFKRFSAEYERPYRKMIAAERKGNTRKAASARKKLISKSR